MTDRERDRAKRHLQSVREGQRAERRHDIGLAGTISWSSTCAGLVVMAGTVVFLAALGTGINIGSMAGPQALAGNTLWAGASLAVSMFIGGYIGAWRRPSLPLSKAAWHGIVLWGLTVSSALLLAAFTQDTLATFARAVFIPQAAATAGSIIATITILMLGCSILGALTATFVISRREVTNSRAARE